jgi:hypothetical protein
MTHDFRRAVLGAALLVGAVACDPDRRGGDEPGPSIVFSPSALTLTTERGIPREAMIVATASGAWHRQFHFSELLVEGSALVLGDARTYESYSTIMLRTSAGLDPGTYRGTLVATICIVSECPQSVGPPRRVPFTVTVLEPMVTPNPVVLTPVGGEAVEADVAVSLPPDESDFDVSVIAGGRWLSVTGRTPGGFRVRAAPERRGTYEGALRVTAGAEVRVVTVRWVADPGRLVVTPDRISISAESGTSTSVPMIVTLPEDVGNWEADVRAPGWLTHYARTVRGLTAYASSMPPGDYEASITFTAGNDTRIVPVEYAVRAPAGTEQGIVASPRRLTLVAAPGESASSFLEVTAPDFAAVEPEVHYVESPSGWLTVERRDGGFEIVASAQALEPGMWAAWVVLSAGATTPDIRVPLAFTVGAGFVRPPDRQVVVTAATTDADLRSSVLVRARDVDQGLRWHAWSDVSFLRLDRLSGVAGEALVFTVEPWNLDSIPPGGSSMATVTIAADDPSLRNARFHVQVSRAIAEITGITPSAQAAGTASRVLVRGRGFGGPPDPVPQVLIDGFGPVDATRRSDEELEIAVPALPAGTYTLRLASAVWLPRLSAELHVFEPGALPYAFFPQTTGIKRGLTYDPVSRTVYLASPADGSVVWYAFSGESWTETKRILPDLADIGLAFRMGLTPSARTLLAVTSSGNLSIIDLDTLAAWNEYTVPEPGGFLAATPSAGIPVTNDGRAWFVMGPPEAPRLVSFDLASRLFVSEPPETLTRETYSSLSRDGERLLLSQPGSLDPSKPILSLDVVDGEFREAPIAERFYTASQSDDGGRVILDGTSVYDRSFGLVGSTYVPDPYRTREVGGFGAVLSPDGSRAYVLAYAPSLTMPARLYVFDTSQVPPPGEPLRKIGERALEDLGRWDGSSPGPSALLTVSPDDATLFIATSSALLVLPTARLFDSAPLP